MHPLGRYAVPFGITLLVIAFLWWVIGPITEYVAQFWPALAIALGIAGLLWMFATRRVRGAIEGLLQIPFTRGILIAALFIAIAALVAVLLPETSGELTAKPGALDRSMVSFLRGTASPLTVFWLIVFGLILRAAAPLIIKKAEMQKAVRVSILLLLAAILGSWLVWGAGWDAVGPHIGAAPTFKPKLMVELKGACVDIAQRLPAWGIINWDTRRVVNPEAIFSDGSKLPLRGDVKDRGNIRAVCGEGVLAASW